jgi:hypothetical protein
MTDNPARQLKLDAILSGMGTDQTSWRDPGLPGDASVNIEQARLASAE